MVSPFNLEWERVDLPQVSHYNYKETSPAGRTTSISLP
jgi:hypothetical protein